MDGAESGMARAAAHCAGALALLLALGAAAAPAGAQTAGDAARGKLLYESRCSACHSIDENRVGPMHRGVLGRKAGGVAGYDYSPALARADFVWTREKLESWLKDPQALVPGQKMNYSVPEAQDRADVIAYLATLKK